MVFVLAVKSYQATPKIEVPRSTHKAPTLCLFTKMSSSGMPWNQNIKSFSVRLSELSTALMLYDYTLQQIFSL